MFLFRKTTSKYQEHQVLKIMKLIFKNIQIKNLL